MHSAWGGMILHAKDLLTLANGWVIECSYLIISLGQRTLSQRAFPTNNAARWDPSNCTLFYSSPNRALCLGHWTM